MCGLAGRFDPIRLADAPGWNERAAALLAHRGPDAEGHFRDDRCELVHRRLALIDLSSAGHQPLPNEDGTVHVVFNGEIYNHRELRGRLQSSGHVFRSSTDSEVLVHLYEDLGERMLEQLRGIFAFAIYDARQRQLLLARDRFGVKPLFCAATGYQWLFASEIKAITALPNFRPELDRQACYDFLGLGYVPEPATGFAGIHALPSGTAMIVSRSGHRVWTYDSVSARPDPARSLADTAEALAARFPAVVDSQSVADVPVAALLSGGIDSSLVVAARTRTNGCPTTTFNVRFPDAAHDESAAATAVARHCGTDHQIIDPTDRRLTAESILQLLRHFDQPFADTSLIPMYWVSAAVRDHGIICALSGDGGDEAFGGYGRFWRANYLHLLMSAPPWVRRVITDAGHALATRTRDLGRQAAKAAALAEAGRGNVATLLAGLSNYIGEEEKAALVVDEARAQLLPCERHYDGYTPVGGCDLEELSRRMTETLFAVSLPSDMLRKVDMMSMRASIEVRVPMLDEDMVAFGLQLPHHLKTDGRRGKLVLRELARRWLPQDIARLPKHGFTIPLDVMVSAQFHHLLEELLLSDDARTRPFLNGAMVRGWLTSFAAVRTTGRSGGALSRGGLYQRVFTVLALELWMRDNGLVW
jgi:asparagine synthase (glutamine-hydrolysing)